SAVRPSFFRPFLFHILRTVSHGFRGGCVRLAIDVTLIIVFGYDEKWEASITPPPCARPGFDFDQCYHRLTAGDTLSCCPKRYRSPLHSAPTNVACARHTCVFYGLRTSFSEHSQLHCSAVSSRPPEPLQRCFCRPGRPSHRARIKPAGLFAGFPAV